MNFLRLKLVSVAICFAIFQQSTAAPATFVFGLPQEVVTLNPFLGSGQAYWRVNKLIYDFLIFEVPGQTNQFVPGLAKSWKISADKKTYEFELRPEAKWHDGVPVTAEDVKFSLEHMFEERYKSLWRGTFEGFDRVQVVNPHLIRITSKEPRFELWKNIASFMRVLPKHFYSDPESKKYLNQAVGSGPYKIVSFESGRKVNLEKNEAWWGWQVEPVRGWYSQPKIQFRTILDETAVGAYILKNELSAYLVPSPSFLKVLSSTESSKYHLVLDPNRNGQVVESIDFNLTDPILSDKKVRRALNLLIDRGSLCQKINPGSGLAEGSYSEKEAKKLLRLAGWSDSDKDGILDRKVGETQVPFVFEVSYYLPSGERILTTLVEHFKKFGIDMRVRSVERTIAWKVFHEKKYQAVHSELRSDAPLLKSVWHSGGLYNNAGLSDKKIDNAFVHLDEEFDHKARIAKTQALQKQIASHFPIIPLCLLDHADFVVRSDYAVTGVKRGVPVWGWF